MYSKVDFIALWNTYCSCDEIAVAVKPKPIRKDPYVSDGEKDQLLHCEDDTVIAVAVKPKPRRKDPYISEGERDQLLHNENDTVEDYYRAQSYQELGSEGDRVYVRIWIDPDLSDEWKKWLDFGITEINTAAPGLCLETTEDKTEARIQVLKGEDPNDALTKDKKNILITKEPVEIHLGEQWPGKKRTATHEMLHALGFKHEQDRKDADKSIQIPPDKVHANNHIIGISRFDPFSIMIYPEKPKNYERKEGVPVWRLKEDKSTTMK